MKNPWKVAKAVYSLAALVRDPERLGQVFALSDSLSSPSIMAPMIADIRSSAVGTRALIEQARIRVKLDELRVLPEGTLGRVFADDMTRRGLSPESIPELTAKDVESFVRAHLYETHDIWHAVTGFATDWKSELGLQAFYLAQFGAPLPAMLLAVGAIRLALFEMSAREELFDAITMGWQLGRKSQKLFGVRWDLLWDIPIEDVRRSLDVTAVELTNEEVSLAA